MIRVRTLPQLLIQLSLDVLEAWDATNRHDSVVDIAILIFRQLLAEFIMITDRVKDLIFVQLAEILEFFDDDIGKSDQFML